MTAQAVIAEIEELPAVEKAKVMAYFESVTAAQPRPGTDDDTEVRRRRYQSAEFTAELTKMMHDAKRAALAERAASDT